MKAFRKFLTERKKIEVKRPMQFRRGTRQEHEN